MYNRLHAQRACNTACNTAYTHDTPVTTPERHDRSSGSDLSDDVTPRLFNSLPALRSEEPNGKSAAFLENCETSCGVLRYRSMRACCRIGTRVHRCEGSLERVGLEPVSAMFRWCVLAAVGWSFGLVLAATDDCESDTHVIHTSSCDVMARCNVTCARCISDRCGQVCRCVQVNSGLEDPLGSFQHLEGMEFKTPAPVDPDGDASTILTVEKCAAKCLNLTSRCLAFGINHGTFSCYFYDELGTPTSRDIKDLYIKLVPTTERPVPLTSGGTMRPIPLTSGGTTQQKQTTQAATTKDQTTSSSMYAPSGGSGGDSTGAIVGGVIAVLLLVVLIALAVPLWRRYKKRKRGEAFYDRMQQNVRMDGIPVDAGTAVRFSGNRTDGRTEQEILLEQGPADGATVEYATVNKNRGKQPDTQELKSSEGAAEGNDLEDDDPSGYDTLQRTRDPYLYPMTIADFDQSEEPEADQGQRSPEVTYAQLDLEDKSESRPVIGGESEEDKTVYSQLRHSRMKYDNLRR
ncbi:hypothetical protein Bbelb_347030 [Branchiostoma belcheri]|nr:hypothetical protein Bbelb_347030 [Branchiostoma belcheri]